MFYGMVLILLLRASGVTVTTLKKYIEGQDSPD
jgi:hypothetical protein